MDRVKAVFRLLLFLAPACSGAGCGTEVERTSTRSKGDAASTGAPTEAAGDDTGKLSLAASAGQSATAWVDTVGLFDRANAVFNLKASNQPGTAEYSVAYGAKNTAWTPLLGDWNGDGLDTLGFYSATGNFYLKDSYAGGAADVTVPYGPANSTWTPLVGDWNGDHVDTVGLFRADTSQFYLRNANTAGVADVIYSFGPANSGWTPIAGDWDGDGTDTVGFYRRDTGTFYLRNSHAGGAADLTFRYGPAASVWKPLAGDWDGDGKDSIGLYDPVAGKFFLKFGNAAGVADVILPYGPTNSAWVPLAGQVSLPNQTSPHYRLVKGLFYDLAGRVHWDDDELNKWVKVYLAGVSRPALVAQMMRSDDQVGVDFRDAMANYAYTLFLARRPTSDEAKSFADALKANTPIQNVVSGVLTTALGTAAPTSDSIRAQLIAFFYGRFLNRPPTGGGEASPNLPLETVYPAIFGSAEYYDLQQKRYLNAFFTSMIELLWRRAPTDSEVAPMVAAAFSGAASVESIVSNVLTSRPYRDREVTGLFQSILGRDPTASELEFYAGKSLKEAEIRILLTPRVLSDRDFVAAAILQLTRRWYDTTAIAESTILFTGIEKEQFVRGLAQSPEYIDNRVLRARMLAGLPMRGENDPTYRGLLTAGHSDESLTARMLATKSSQAFFESRVPTGRYRSENWIFDGRSIETICREYGALPPLDKVDSQLPDACQEFCDKCRDTSVIGWIEVFLDLRGFVTDLLKLLDALKPLREYLDIRDFLSCIQNAVTKVAEFTTDAPTVNDNRVPFDLSPYRSDSHVETGASVTKGLIGSVGATVKAMCEWLATIKNCVESLIARLPFLPGPVKEAAKKVAAAVGRLVAAVGVGCTIGGVASMAVECYGFYDIYATGSGLYGGCVEALHQPTLRPSCFPRVAAKVFPKSWDQDKLACERAPIGVQDHIRRECSVCAAEVEWLSCKCLDPLFYALDRTKCDRAMAGSTREALVARCAAERNRVISSCAEAVNKLYPDADGDRWPDRCDRCPGDAPGPGSDLPPLDVCRSGFTRCDPGCSWVDGDGDCICASRDKCPGHGPNFPVPDNVCRSPNGEPVFYTSDGCYKLDPDGDGLCGGKDACPDIACPEPDPQCSEGCPDRDCDGLPDRFDYSEGICPTPTPDPTPTPTPSPSPSPTACTARQDLPYGYDVTECGSALDPFTSMTCDEIDAYRQCLLEKCETQCGAGNCATASGEPYGTGHEWICFDSVQTPTECTTKEEQYYQCNCWTGTRPPSPCEMNPDDCASRADACRNFAPSPSPTPSPPPGACPCTGRTQSQCALDPQACMWMSGVCQCK